MGQMKSKFDPETEQAGMLLIAIARHSVYPGIHQRPIRAPQAVFLMELMHRGEASMSEIAGHARVHATVMSHFVDRLVKKGLVERVQDEEDRRVVRVRLTPQGRETAQELVARYMSKLDAVLKRSEEKDRATFLRMLNEIDTALSE